jgi:hypothetical protein
MFAKRGSCPVYASQLPSATAIALIVFGLLVPAKPAPALSPGQLDQLGQQALAVSAQCPSCAWLYAVEGLRTARTTDTPAPLAEEFLRTSLLPFGRQASSGASPYVFTSRVSPDGRWLVVSGNEPQLRLWDTGNRTGQPLLLEGHTAPAVGLAFTPDGRYLLSGGKDTLVLQWDLADPERAPVLLGKSWVAVASATVSPDGRWLVTGGEDGSARLWDLTLGEPSEPIELQGPDEYAVSVQFSSDGRYLVIAGEEGGVWVWDIVARESALAWKEAAAAAGEPLPEGAEDAARPLRLRAPARITSFMLAPEGDWLAAGCDDGRVVLWHRGSGATPASVWQGHSGRVTQVLLGPDARVLASAGDDGVVNVYDLLRPEAPAARLLGHRGATTALALADGGRRLVTGGRDGTARLWDLEHPERGEVILRGHDDALLTLGVSSDGRWLTTASEHATAVWPLGLDDLLDWGCRAAGRNLTAAEWRAAFPQEAYKPTCEQWPSL